MTTNGEWDSRDAAMLDLFRLEVETQVALLNDGLLALERDPHDTAALASLMRAAHSIKGAARVVQIERGREGGARDGGLLRGRPGRQSALRQRAD